MCIKPKDKIARRAAREIMPGMVVNLGIGIPTLIANYISEDLPLTFHSENGIIGAGKVAQAGQADRNLIDADSFGMIRGGHINLAILGAMLVDQNGDLANWIIPGKFAPGIGGAMELAQKARKLIITTTHTTKKGEPKILEFCTLPLTAKGCVDMIITELAVISVHPENGMILQEIAMETNVDEVLAVTEAPLTISENLTTF